MYRRLSAWPSLGVALALLMVLSLPLSTRAEEKVSDNLEALLLAERLEKSIATALASHRAELAELKTQLQKLETMQVAVEAELRTYDSQNTANSQLMLIPTPQIGDLEIALNNNRLTSRTLAHRIETFQDSYDSRSILFQQTVDRFELVKKQMADIEMFQLPEARKQTLDLAIQTLLQLMTEKKELGERYLEICGDLLERMRAALETKKAIRESLATRLKSLKKESLWTRDRYRDLDGNTLQQALGRFGRRISALGRPETWTTLWDHIKMGGVAPWAIFLFQLVLYAKFLQEVMINEIHHH